MSPERRLNREVGRDRGKSKVSYKKRKHIEGRKCSKLNKDEERSDYDCDFVYKKRAKKSHYKDSSDEELYSDGDASDNSGKMNDSPLLKKK
ncbi:hypothetical protein ACS0TY_010696 [Phlomoides rotata]